VPVSVVSSGVLIIIAVLLVGVASAVFMDRLMDMLGYTVYPTASLSLARVKPLDNTVNVTGVNATLVYVYLLSVSNPSPAWLNITNIRVVGVNANPGTDFADPLAFTGGNILPDRVAPHATVYGRLVVFAASELPSNPFIVEIEYATDRGDTGRLVAVAR